MARALTPETGRIRSRTFAALENPDYRRYYIGQGISLIGTYREKYQQAYNFDPSAYQLSSAPLIDIDGSVTGQAGAVIPNSGNPYTGLVQCGVGGIPAGCMKGHLFNQIGRASCRERV